MIATLLERSDLLNAGQSGEHPNSCSTTRASLLENWLWEVDQTIMAWRLLRWLRIEAKSLAFTLLKNKTGLWTCKKTNFSVTSQVEETWPRSENIEMKITAFRNVSAYSLPYCYQRFGTIWCLHHHGTFTITMGTAGTKLIIGLWFSWRSTFLGGGTRGYYENYRLLGDYGD